MNVAINLDLDSGSFLFRFVQKYLSNPNYLWLLGKNLTYNGHIVLPQRWDKNKKNVQ